MKSAQVALLLACGVAAVGRAEGPPAGAAASPSARLSGTSVRATSVNGAAWNADNTPIAAAHVQLRNLVTGKIVGTAVADEAGRFAFSNLEGGTYAVELVGLNRRIVTVGHAFEIAPGESVATFVRLGSKVPWFTGFFSNAAAASAASAAGLGITALAPVQLPISSSGSGTVPR